MRVGASGRRVVPVDSEANGQRVALVPGSIADHSTCLLLKIGQVVFRLMEAHLSQMGLRIRHYSVLCTLHDGGPVSQLDLGAYLRIDGATMVATIDDLEGLGYVSRRRGSEDRRRSVISLLPAGELVLKEVEELISRLDDVLLADITDRQREQLQRTLTKLSQGGTLVAAFDELRGR